MDKNIAKNFVDSALDSAEFAGKHAGTKLDFYEALERVYERAEKLGVEPDYFRSRALAVETNFVTRQIKYYERKIKEAAKQKNNTAVRAFTALRNREQSFLKSLEDTGKTAVELGKVETANRIFIAIDSDTLLKDDAALYAMLV